MDLMIEQSGAEKGSDWKKFIRRHWKMVSAFAIAGILLFTDAIYVFLLVHQEMLKQQV